MSDDITEGNENAIEKDDDDVNVIQENIIEHARSNSIWKRKT